MDTYLVVATITLLSGIPQKAALLLTYSYIYMYTQSHGFLIIAPFQSTSPVLLLLYYYYYAHARSHTRGLYGTLSTPPPSTPSSLSFYPN